jgi:hypothetical protein
MHSSQVHLEVYCLYLNNLTDLFRQLSMDKSSIFFWTFIGTGSLGVIIYVLIHMHHNGHGCFARRSKKADVEQGRALPEVPSFHRSSEETILNAAISSHEPSVTAATVPNQLDPVMASVNVPLSESTDAVANKSEV